MLVGFRNMSTFNKLKNRHAARTRSYIIVIWRAQGFVESIQDYWMSVDVWLQLLETNMEIHLPSDFVFNDKLLQEVVSKDCIINIVFDMNRNDVVLY